MSSSPAADNDLSVRAPNSGGMDSSTASAIPHADNPIGSDHIGQTAIGLAAVILVILVCGALLKRFGPYRRRSGQALRVVASQGLGQRERVVVVEIADTWLVLGVAQNSVNTLHKLPAQRDDTSSSNEARAASGQTPSFSQALAENVKRATTQRFGGRP